MKREKSQKLLLYLVGAVSLLSLIILVWKINSDSRETAPNGKGHNVALNQTYQYHVDSNGVRNSQIKLLKNHRYVIYIEKYTYLSDKKLKEKERLEEQAIYPELTFTQGNYKKTGNYISLEPQHSTIIRFYDISVFHQKKYFEKENKKLMLNSGGKIISSWKGLYYQTKGINNKMNKIKLKKSSKVIPSSEEDFLEQYTYDPSTKDDR
ncbi:Uncharacterised protein [Streptococcus criceti]|uniref:Uncharacterized protein n=1 Tax=Streptococcus criceti HS-6 TaxID=873449 RepID=G5JN98_STRCG|nr:hypothetical protein [Streptococcus criceti]EHI73297.1 hypothetical protein STRCR_0135 [Streptococcus criceti HS-6]SUN41648.1 Uncharacterised protein [Streptococcus criceti]